MLPLNSASGLTASVTSTGALAALSAGDLVVNLYPGTELEGGPTQLYLRRRGAEWASTPLLGPAAPGRLREGDGFIVDGEWEGVSYSAELVLAADAAAWFWHVRLTNNGAAGEFDLIHTADIGLSGMGMLRNNEFYVSQYLDHTALEHAANGSAVASRNNLGHGGGHPWTVIGSLGRATGYATDALAFHGLSLRTDEPTPGLAGDLPSSRLQHEHAMTSIQEESFELGAGDSVQKGFFGLLVRDHPQATSQDDAALIDGVLALPEASHDILANTPHGAPVSTLFAAAPRLATRDLTDAEIAELWGTELRHVEEDNGTREAFFTPSGSHVVLRHKDARVLRPHGHMLRTGDNLVPDESQLMVTCYMDGFIATQLTEGHVGVNKALSTRRSYLGLQKAAGLRIFVEVAGSWQLLDLASAFAMTLNSATWIYAHDGATITIVETAAPDSPRIDLSVSVAGAPTRFLLALHTTLNDGEDGAHATPASVTTDPSGFSVHTPEANALGSFRFDVSAPFAIADDAALFSDATSRNLPWVCVTVEETHSVEVTMTANLLPRDELAAAAESILRIAPADTEAAYLSSLLNGLDLASSTDPDISRLGATIPWYIHNALIHYLAPRGLEQFNGGGWGTRDISQGPVELLLALGHHEPIRELLKLVFVAQNDHGGWPQAFGFFDRNMFRHADDDPHGDVHFWPPLALAQYIVASGDTAILDEVVGYHVAGGGNDSGTMLDHVQRAIGYINERLIDGTMLISYGHGDWNDSLQPADHSMTETLVSSWTVTLHFQMLRALTEAFELAGRAELAAEYAEMAEKVLAGFQSMIVDDVLAGYVSYRNPDELAYLVHPRDDRSGLTYSELTIVHSIMNDMFTPEQAKAHKKILEKHLVAPDGARLFDTPPVYRGGPQEIFQRAESASFFGREIGIMYMHSHLRYAEAMARYGDADAMFLAMRQAIPLGYSDAVPNALPRQSNCYYSSSDAAVTDRYQARDEYGKIMDGSIQVQGGWRIYSSGAGISVRLITECLLGMKRGRDTTVIDPVLPAHLDGLAVGMSIGGKPVEIRYSVSGSGSGVRSVEVNGQAIATTALSNPYRDPGVSVRTADITALLTGTNDHLTVSVG
jgi:1,2-beta-oligoglucan phosphorylase